MIKADLRKVLADNVKAYRSAKGLSQEELADECGLHLGGTLRTQRHPWNA
jgi:transcriptional regulator with XRE-family HTH domain